ncbi:MAG: PIN domain nuclease [Chloroflexi bacterium]|nr:PIN domain nuclease [Chloroflexota bacterium]MCI0580816.1 PIN domain nuclease [Chloroflexota bacterium]MCI0648190.1 PIN domain nuclease [Chloroflexota bacterium]MCI0730332.1 PIN domain nuclease [Chloroflexota bacterium]
MTILVDTSVWVDFFRGNSTAPVIRLKALVGREEILLGDLILAELLQGVKDDQDLKRVNASFSAYRVVPLVGEAMARQSALYYRQLRERGITIRKTIDCLIATWCIRNHVPLLHNDRDFHSFVSLGLKEVLEFKALSEN